jgi:hypothetical protein
LAAGETFTIEIVFSQGLTAAENDVLSHLTDGIDLLFRGLTSPPANPPISKWQPTPPNGPTTGLVVKVAGPVETANADQFNSGLDLLLRGVRNRPDGSSTSISARVSRNIDQNGVARGPA